MKQKSMEHDMIGKKLVVALAILIGATSISMAQTVQNKGAARNHGGDSYGEPYSGSAAARQQSGH
jgi:hypothetical protein